MADVTRGERTVRLFAQVISNPTKKYTVADLMELLDISESERRNDSHVKLFLEENFNWVESFSDVARAIKPAALKQKLSEYVDYLKKIYG